MKKLSPDMNDEQLDKLFQEMAENIKPAYDPDMWLKVKNALEADKDDQPKTAFIYKRLPGFLLLLLLISGGFLLWQINSPRQELPHNSGFTDQRVMPSIARGTDKKTAASPAATKRISRIQKGMAIAGKNNQALFTQEKADNNQSQQTDINNLSSAGRTDENSYYLPPLIASLPTGNLKPGVTQVYEQRKAVKGKLGDAAGQAPRPDTIKGRRVNYKWALALSAGPDWSSVHGSGSKPGVDAGITLQYNISKKWSVESGLLLASKIYDARPGDYHAPSSYSDLVQIEARCLVYDLPLNIRYNILQQKQHTFFVSSGLSSFWMQHEGYTFYYKQSGNIETWQRDIYNQNKHFLSIANFSAGYEHKWNRLSMQAAPYLKLPLSGIGYGKVKLASKGVLISVKYGF